MTPLDADYIDLQVAMREEAERRCGSDRRVDVVQVARELRKSQRRQEPKE